MENEDVVWENKTLYLINKLENVQIGAARIVTWGTRLVFIMKRQVGRRNRQDGNITKEYIYKMVNGLVPPYLSAMVPFIYQVQCLIFPYDVFIFHNRLNVGKINRF
jgi:hypothetical protein